MGDCVSAVVGEVIIRERCGTLVTRLDFLSTRYTCDEIERFNLRAFPESVSAIVIEKINYAKAKLR
jgi:hypothetical protein